jgi:AraC-like DNA-binding protein
MTKISLDTIRSLINYLTLQGADKTRILSLLQLGDENLNQSRQLVDSNVYQKLFEFGEQLIADPQLGFHFGQQIEAERWGVLGHIAFTSATLADAVAKQRQYQTIVGNLGTPLFEKRENLITLKWIPSHPFSHHIAEEIIVSWVAIARKLTLSGLAPTLVTFVHPCTSDIKSYQDYFGCEVRFEQDVHSLTIGAEILQLPLCRHDPELHQLLCTHADKILADMVEKLPMQVMREYIRDQLPIALPDIEGAAQHMRTSVRTLQRKLKEQGLTYSALVENIRKEVAIAYLSQTDTDLTHITQMLGFSEQSAFQRAFKRWFGVTPKQFRDRN